MSGTYNPLTNCEIGNYFQIDAVSDDVQTLVQHDLGDISGISDGTITVSGGTISGSWTIPSGIPSKAYGHMYTPTWVSLRSGGYPGTKESEMGSIVGSFTMTPCSCPSYNAMGCGVGSCAPSQLNQTRSCNPDKCDVETTCVNPVQQIDNVGCGVWCADKGQCDLGQMCKRYTDANGCLAQNYQCVNDASCNFDCGTHGATSITLTLFSGWNAISLPCNLVTVLKDTCGATNGNFYFYDAVTGKWNISTVGIANLVKGVGYWFYTTRTCNITFTGGSGASNVVPADLTIKLGWNQVGSTTAGLNNAGDAVKSCQNCLGYTCENTRVMWWDTLAQQWRQVNKMALGRGYSVDCIAQPLVSGTQTSTTSTMYTTSSSTTTKKYTSSSSTTTTA
jgi:hypothetical protein